MPYSWNSLPPVIREEEFRLKVKAYPLTPLAPRGAPGSHCSWVDLSAGTGLPLLIVTRLEAACMVLIHSIPSNHSSVSALVCCGDRTPLAASHPPQWNMLFARNANDGTRCSASLGSLEGGIPNSAISSWLIRGVVSCPLGG